MIHEQYTLYSVDPQKGTVFLKIQYKRSIQKMSVSKLDSKLDARSIHLRHKLLQIIEHCRRGHIGSSLSLLEILRVLYDDILLYNSAQSNWPDRDRFILSKGHGCLSLYMLLAEKGLSI